MENRDLGPVLIPGKKPLAYRGGPLPDTLSSTASVVQNLIEMKARELWKDAGSPNDLETPHFFYVNDPTFNAWTGFDGTTPTININITVLLVLCRLFQRALISPKVFPGTKDCPAIEGYVEPPPGSWTLDFALDRTRTLEENCKAFTDPISGLPDSRWKLAQTFAQLATLYIGFHEFAHIACGHTQYHVVHFGGSGLQDFTSLENSDPHYQEMRRLWEVQADNIGTQFFVAMVLGAADVYKERLEVDSSASTEEYLGKALFGPFVTYMMFAEKEPETITQDNEHPHSFQRGYLYFIFLHRALGKWFSDLRWDEVQLHMSSNSEAALNQLAYAPPRWLLDSETLKEWTSETEWTPEMTTETMKEWRKDTLTMLRKLEQQRERWAEFSWFTRVRALDIARNRPEIRL